ncbi:hypothetical protein [Serinibacter arcticus]|uniref:Integral membrane protein n=1 Tax=Serinibacter arcticus TaxID=1655435 RepID=A0A4Z1E2X8_9MICO|nr:hypothetical protein [Serinibacter arcticus]TGO06405.1 integral membrane protein [Serinibacter arcticus]
MTATASSTGGADLVTTYSVLTPQGRRDVVLTGAVTVADLLEAVQLPATTALLTAGGLVLHANDDLDRLAGGEVLVVGVRRGEGPSRGRTRDEDDDEDVAAAPAALAAPLWAVAGATGALALVRAAELAGGGADAAVPVWPAVLAGLLAVVLAILGPRRGAAATATTVATWTAAAAGGLLAVPGGLLDPAVASPLLLPVTTALLAASAAVALRYASLHGTSAAVLAGVVLAFTGALASAGAVAVMTGTGVVGACAVVLGLAPIVARALPAGSLDVPDHVVVDLSAAQRTATSVREREVASPPFVRGHTVRRSVTTAQARRSSAAVLLGVVVAVLAPVVLLAPLPEPTGWTSHVQLWATGALGVVVSLALVLIPRQERLTAARLGPRLAAGATAVLSAVWFARVLDAGVLPVAVALLAAVLAVATSFALGRGWRSVRASRSADALESVAVALAPALGLLTAGVLAWLRLLASG